MTSPLLRILVLLSIFLSACTTTTRYTPYGIADKNVTDTVVVVLRDGRELSGHVASVDETNLYLDQDSSDTVLTLPIADVQQIEHEKVSVGKTVGLATLILVGALIIAVRADGGIAFFPGPPTL